MYYVEIKTKYNIIKLAVEDTNDPQLLEILEQPYVEDVKIKTIEQLTQEKANIIRKLKNSIFVNFLKM